MEGKRTGLREASGRPWLETTHRQGLSMPSVRVAPVSRSWGAMASPPPGGLPRKCMWILASQCFRKLNPSTCRSGMDSVSCIHVPEKTLSQGPAGSGEPCRLLGAGFLGLTRPGCELRLALGLPLRESRFPGQDAGEHPPNPEDTYCLPLSPLPVPAPSAHSSEE